MAPKASEESSPARTALEKSLTLNRKQSWYGSIRSAVHQSALSAKAAVESLRGGSNNHASLVGTDTRLSPDTPSKQRPTPVEQSVRDTPSIAKSAITSLRHQFSRRSRNLDRGNVSSVFRRSSNASSLRDRETNVRHSRDLSWRISRLSMRPDTQDDVTGSASSTPLPSSPIPIPTPAPKLKLDFGQPELLSPFAGIYHTALAEIKVLQDPRNITTGCPSSGPVTWPVENKHPCPLPREPVVSGTLSANIESKETLTKSRRSMAAPTSGTEDPFNQFFPPITVPELSLQSEPDVMKHISPKRNVSNAIGRLEWASVHMETDASPMFAMSHGSYAEDPSALGVRNPGSIEDFAGLSIRAMSDVSTTPTKSLVSHGKESVAPEEEHISPIELLELPPPLFGLGTRPGKDSGNNIDCAGRGQREAVEPNTPESPVNCTQRPLIGASVSNLSSLIADAAKKSREVNFIERAATAGLSRKGSCTVMARKSSESLYENDDTLDKAKAWSPSSAIDPASVGAIQNPMDFKENDCLRKVSLFQELNVEDSTAQYIPQHGPPSPTRKVMLPLRPKKELTSHTPYESTVFKPNLERAAAKQLGAFRPGSDPSLRQRYFPHLPVSPIALVTHARQSSLDSDDNGTPTTQNSSERSNIFERAVETPSPLQIRKQSGFTVTHFSCSPDTPKEGPAAPYAEHSSPTRTPSMGDRQLFELQRAERNARYNAVYSNGQGAKGDDDSGFRLADFDNAGPGSRSSLPKSNNSEEAIGMEEVELLFEQALASLPAP